MAIVHRRIFYAKVGAADQLVKLMQDADALMVRHGMNMKTRISTDYLNGRSDRVSVEWEVDDVSQLDSGFDDLMKIPEVAAFMGPWMETLNSLIHYADGENWKVR